MSSVSEAYFQHLLREMLRTDPSMRPHSLSLLARHFKALETSLRPKVPAVCSSIATGCWWATARCASRSATSPARGPTRIVNRRTITCGCAPREPGRARRGRDRGGGAARRAPSAGRVRGDRRGRARRAVGAARRLGVERGLLRGARGAPHAAAGRRARRPLAGDPGAGHRRVARDDGDGGRRDRHRAASHLALGGTRVQGDLRAQGRRCCRCSARSRSRRCATTTICRRPTISACR